MDYFEQDKADKLQRLLGLRIMNAVGMVAWRKDCYNGAQQCLRLLHPLSWVWFPAITVAAVFMGGVPETIRDLRKVFCEETVWW